MFYRIMAAFCLCLYTGSMLAQPAQRFDIVIDEIMADPSPQVQLPNAEFIEIKNTSGRTLNLSGWRFTTSTSQSGFFPVYNLPADSFLLITSTSNASLFQGYSKVIGVTSFPSLDNDGSTLTLVSKEGIVIHALAYSKSWYRNDLKSEGGWTLEMIDTKNPCTGENNWKASVALAGGSPGTKNSVDDVNADDIPPQLVRSYATDSLNIIAVFNEPVDSMSASITGAYKINGVTVSSAKPVAPLFQQVKLKLQAALQKQTVYSLEVANVKDCKGNIIGVVNKVKTGVSEDPLNGEIIVNEILFNPWPAGEDYVELYNRTNKIFNLGKLFLGNRSSSGAAASFKKISEVDLFLYPGDFVVITSDADALSKQYFIKDPSAVVLVTSMPSYPDDKGNVLVTDVAGKIIDEVVYSENWHFALIADAEGVALERIDPDDSSNVASNWQSAASTAGYGTPGYKNSQYKTHETFNAAITALPRIFSPDNDGRDDFVTITYNVDQPGFMGNVSIYNSSGVVVKKLVNSGSMGIKGSWKWDGLDEKRQPLPAGMYIIYTGIFNVAGKVKTFKNLVLLAKKF
jgi:hypothetical protein